MSDRTEIALTLPTAEQLLKQLGTALQGAPVAQEPDGSRWIELDWLTDKICEIVKSGIRTLPANPAVKLEIGNPIILEPGLPDGEVKGLIMICDLKVQSGRATVIVGPKLNGSWLPRDRPRYRDGRRSEGPRRGRSDAQPVRKGSPATA